MRAAAPRLVSLDVLRGFVIAAMVFVNHAGDMPGMPHWVGHAASAADEYTFADLVFPAFLFMVGAALPFSLGKHLGPGGAGPAFARIAPRVLGLVLLGLIYVNGDRYDEAATGMSRRLWTFLALGAAVLLWNAARWVRPWLKALASLLLAWLVVGWHGKPVDGWPHLVPSWWGILGLIGWAYLVCAIAYLVCRGDRAALLGVMALMMCVYIGDRHGRHGFLAPLDGAWSTGSFLGSTSGIVMAGAVAGQTLKDRHPGREGFLLLYGLGLWAAGWLLRPLHGYHKNAGTESWSLAAAGITALGLWGCHLAFDGVRPPGRIARLFAFAGRNALLAYVLPDLLGALAGAAGMDLVPWWGRGGPPGTLNVLGLTLAVIALAAAGTRVGFVVRL